LHVCIELSYKIRIPRELFFQEHKKSCARKHITSTVCLKRIEIQIPPKTDFIGVEIIHEFLCLETNKTLRLGSLSLMRPSRSLSLTKSNSVVSSSAATSSFELRYLSCLFLFSFSLLSFLILLIFSRSLLVVMVRSVAVLFALGVLLKNSHHLFRWYRCHRLLSYLRVTSLSPWCKRGWRWEK